MVNHKPPFVEICIYDVRPDKVEAFEELLKQVAAHHTAHPGVRDVRYMKRTHRAGDFASTREGKPPIRLTRKAETVTYVLYWELETPEAHGEATRAGLEKFYAQFRKCLAKAPKIILGERLI